MKRFYFLSMLFACVSFLWIHANLTRSGSSLTKGDREIHAVSSIVANTDMTDAEANRLKWAIPQTQDLQFKASTGKTVYAFSSWDEENSEDSIGWCSFNLADASNLKLLRHDPFVGQVWGGTVVNGELFAMVSKSEGISFSKMDINTGKATDIAIFSLSSLGFYIQDLAYDYTTGTMYFIYKSCFSCDDIYYGLGIVDLKDGTMTPIGKFPDFMYAVACNSEGQLFSLGKEGFYKVNKSNAALEFVSQIKTETANMSDIGFDFEDGTLYRTGNGPTTGFFSKINVLSGEEIVISPFVKNTSLNSLYIPFTVPEAKAPATISELSFKSAEGGASATTISFKAPTKTYDKSALSAITSIQILRDNSLVKTFSAPVAGSSLSYTDNTTAGEHAYKIVVINTMGSSIPACRTISVGADLPGNPSNVKLEASGLSAILNWDKPASGWHGGWYDASQLAYKITRYPDNVVVAENVKANTYTDVVPQYGKYMYTIQALTQTGAGGTVVSDRELIGTEIVIPYFCGFKTDDEFSLWSVDNNSGDPNKNWMYRGSKYAEVRTYSKGSWLYSPSLRLQANKTYQLQFDVKTQSANAKENLKVSLGKEKLSSSQTNTLLTLTDYADRTYKTQYTTIKTSETGIYYLGFYYDFGVKGGEGVYITNVCVSEEFDHDLSVFSVKGQPLPMVGKTYAYKVQVMNSGKVVQNEYKVELLQGETVLNSVEIKAELTPGSTRTETVNWTPKTPGAVDLVARVVMETDLNVANNSSAPYKVNVQAAGDKQWAVVGDGILYDDKTPIRFDFNNNVSQSIYLASDIETYGTIEKIYYTCSSNMGQDISAPLKIYMATSPKTQILTPYEWLSESEKILVFDGMIKVPNNKGELEIELSKPFVYAGDNLCLFVERAASTSYPSIVSFMVTESSEKRTLMYTDPSEPFNNSAKGSLLNYSANLKLLMNTAGGTIKGVVKSGETPLVGVRVSVKASNANVITDKNGVYEIVYLPQGNHTLVFSAKGYEEQTIENLQIAKNEVKIQDMSLNVLPSFALSGTVTHNGSPVENAKIEIMGYEAFTTSTKADGRFSFPKVYKAVEYKVNVTKTGILPYKSTFDMDDKDLNWDIRMADIPYAPQQVTALKKEMSVDISWTEPGNKVFRYDDGVVSGNLGTNDVDGEIVMGTAHKTPATLNGMSWFTQKQKGPHTTVNIFVIDLDPNGLPTKKILFQQMNVPNTDEKWSSFTFPTPVECPNGFMVAVGYKGYIALAHDAGTSRDYPYAPQGNYFGYYQIGEYARLENERAYNFMVRAEGYQMEASVQVSNLPIKLASLPSFSSSISLIEKSCEPYISEETEILSDTKGAQYKIWRLKEKNVTNESSWELLTSLPINVRNYSDKAWNTISDGAYMYAVRTIYPQIVSAPTFSNMIAKNMIAKVTMNVKTNADANADGTKITLVNTDGKLQHLYAATITNGTAILDSIWKGHYSVKVEKDKFEVIQQANVDITSDKIFDYELKQIKIEPLNLTIGTTDKDTERIFEWNVFSTITEDFESHENLAINSPGKIGWNYIDGDGRKTAWFGGYEKVPNGYGPKAYMILNPSAMTPSMLESYKNLAPHSGNQLMISVSPDQGSSQDYFISPELSFVSDFTFSFWARAFDRQEKMRVGYSTTGKEANDFIWITPDKYVTLNVGPWKQYSYIIPYSAKYVVLECVSDNCFVFMVDDVFIGVKENSGEILNYEVYLDEKKVSETKTNSFKFTELTEGNHIAGVKAIYASGATGISTIPFEVKISGVDTIEDTNVSVYPNPMKDILQVRGEYERLEIYGASGRLEMEVSGSDHVVVSGLSVGSYILKVYQKGKISYHKLIKQ